MKHISAITNKVTDDHKRFAWLPVKLDSNRIVWLTYYYEIVTFMAISSAKYNNMLDCEKLSVDEYIVRKLMR
jgi:hypothetical protein